MAVDLKKPNDELDKFLLRMPDGLRDQLKAAAEASNRSMNAEIVSRLEFSLRAHPHAYLIRALIDMQESLLTKHTITISEELNDVLVERARQAGYPPQEFMMMLIRAALDELDNNTEIGRDIAASLEARFAKKDKDAEE